MNVKRTHRGTLGRAGGALDRLDGDDNDPQQAAKKAQLQAVREVMRERQRKDTAKRREMQREAARNRGTTAPGGNTGGNATIQQQHGQQGYPAAEEGYSRRNGYNQQHGVHCGSSNGVNLPIHDDGVHYNCGMGSGDGRVGRSAHRLPFFDDDDGDGAASLRERYPWWFTEDMALEEFNLDWRDPDTVQMLLDLEAEIMAEERSQVVGAEVEEDAEGDTAPYVHHHEDQEEDYGTSVALAMYESCYGGDNQDQEGRGEQQQNSIGLCHSTLNQHSPYTGPQQPTPTPTYRAVNTARWNTDSSKQMTVPQGSQFPQLPPSISTVLPLQPPPPTGSITTSAVEPHDDDDDKDWEEYYRSMH